MANSVPFHEHGRKFFWNIASKKVSINGKDLSTPAYSLTEARRIALFYIARMEKKESLPYRYTQGRTK